MAPDRGHAPGGALGDLRRHEADDVLARADAAGHAQHELEMQRRAMSPSAHEAERLVDVPDLVALELGDAAGRADALRRGRGSAGAC